MDNYDEEKFIYYPSQHIDDVSMPIKFVGVPEVEIPYIKISDNNFTYETSYPIANILLRHLNKQFIYKREYLSLQDRCRAVILSTLRSPSLEISQLELPPILKQFIWEEWIRRKRRKYWVSSLLSLSSTL